MSFMHYIEFDNNTKNWYYIHNDNKLRLTNTDDKVHLSTIYTNLIKYTDINDIIDSNGNSNINHYEYIAMYNMNVYIFIPYIDIDNNYVII